MIIQKTIEVPASRKVHFDVTLPEKAPCGETEVILEFPRKTDDFTYPPDFDPRLKGAVNPALRGTVKTVGDIIGPFHDVWENGY
jgi:hypothetical protein